MNEYMAISSSLHEAYNPSKTHSHMVTTSHLTNMALPSTTNLKEELTIVIVLFNWFAFTIVLTGISALLSDIYALYILLVTQWGTLPAHITSIQNSFIYHKLHKSP